eukprot:CAMPEP_0115039112 /NCGR_PEP_ID=MMETSP0216-20121206/43813_1 /TAXON_ID=223996 /ORGANISM="Protocruzia adherens, Strain Boccale" /LENGTH=222 /DNA_ID=CAMNT_0002419647 /DNA_START=228 /DNA_END=896 /DNA_ORIENTATION=+
MVMMIIASTSSKWLLLALYELIIFVLALSDIPPINCAENNFSSHWILQSVSSLVISLTIVAVGWKFLRNDTSYGNYEENGPRDQYSHQTKRQLRFLMVSAFLLWLAQAVWDVAIQLTKDKVEKAITCDDGSNYWITTTAGNSLMFCRTMLHLVLVWVLCHVFYYIPLRQGRQSLSFIHQDVRLTDSMIETPDDPLASFHRGPEINAEYDPLKATVVSGESGI